jgi:Ser/Thr protein kinase RdoA (MazF antagonist)
VINLAAIWDLPADTAVRPLGHGGYNNHLHRVDIGGKPAFVLREYGNHNSPRMIEHELSVLLQLQRHKLPFLIPAPEITRRGELCATVEAPGGMHLLVLIPFVDGTNPEPGNLAQCRAVGAAIAQLGQALKKVDTRGLRLPPSYRALERVHPLVPDPLMALTDIDELGATIDADTAERVNALIARLCGEANARWQSLGQQLTHGDVIPGNVLVKGDSVAAVIDFENCAINPRAMDLAGALDTWLFDVLHKPDQLWPRFDALGRGYTGVTKLPRDEIAALPMLILLRNTSVLMHLCGRFIGGLTPAIDVESWIDSLVALDDWLAAHGAELIERAALW